MTTATQTRLATPAEVRSLLRWAGVVAFDLETTGLDSRRNRIRLLSVSDGNRSLVLDAFEHDIRQVLPYLRDKILIAHNAAFDLGFLWEAGLTDLPETICTVLLALLVTAGEGEGSHGFPLVNLQACVQRWLKRELPKELQNSDWSGPLSDEQVEYARRDARVLIPLYNQLAKELVRLRLVQVSDIELRALPAFVWMAQSGVPFNRSAWEALTEKASRQKDRLGRELDAKAPIKGNEGLFGAVEYWNWDSPQQVQEVLSQLGFDVGTTNDAQLALINHPFAEQLRDFRHQSQLVKMYGAHWLAAATIAGGRLYPSWKQIGAASGRTSCKEPNCQQIPRDEVDGKVVYRTCFEAAPGKVLVKADYSTLQMRIAAKWANDQALIKTFREGGDPHTATAQALLGKQDVSKGDRQIAKSANFALLFGAGAEGLRIYAKTTYGLNLTEKEAVRHRSRFFEVYNGLARWHMETRQRHTKETRCASGRRRAIPDMAPDTWRLNSPVQGDEADGLKLSMALLWERRRECPSAVPVLAVHDEIVIEVDADQEERAKAWLVQAMLDGMRPWMGDVPIEVEAKSLPSWGG